MAATVLVRRVVLVADAILEADLLREIERLEFAVSTSVDCSGRGSQAVIEDRLSGRSRVRIEAIGSDQAAQCLLDYIRRGPLSRHSIVTFFDSVELDRRIAAA